MNPKPRSKFQILGWVILIAMLGLSFFVLPWVMTLMHDGIPDERLALWLPLYVLTLAFPVMAAHFYWIALRKYLAGFTFWLVVSAATLGLVLLHHTTFGERIFSNHREVATFFVGAFMGGTLGGMIVFGLVSRFAPRWLGMSKTQPNQSAESDRQKNQIGLRSIFFWTAGIAVIAAAFTNPEKLLLLENDSFRVVLYQLFTFIGYAVFCTFLFLPVQAWLSNVTPRWLGKLSLLVFSVILPPGVLWLICVITIGAMVGEEMIVTLMLSAMLFYLSVYAIVWNQACRWSGIVAENEDGETVRRRGGIGTAFSLLRSGAKYLILASTVAFVLLSIIWGGWHLVGGQAQEVGLVNERIHTLLGSENKGGAWMDAVNDYIANGVTVENNLAVKLIRICNPYAVVKRDASEPGSAGFTLVINDSDPGRHREIERLGLTLEQLAQWPPLETRRWLANAEYDFQQQLEEDFPEVAKRLEIGFLDLDSSQPDAESEEPELTRDELMARHFMVNGVNIEALTTVAWRRGDCALGAEFVEMHRAKTEQLVELMKETTFFVPAVRKYDGSILYHDVFNRLAEEPEQLLTATAYFDLGNGDVEKAVENCGALWRLGRLSPWGGRGANGTVLRHARELSKAIVFSGAATEVQMRRVLGFYLKSTDISAALPRAQKLNRVFHLGRVYDRMTTPTRHTEFQFEHEPTWYLYQTCPWMVDWEAFLDRTEQLADQIDENEQALLFGTQTWQEHAYRAEKSLGEKFPNGAAVFLNMFNRFPAQQFSVFVHGPEAKGKMLGESLAIETWFRRGRLSALPALQAREIEQDKIAIGLEIYKTNHSVYPVKLQDLVPEIMPAIPVDPVTLLGFLYTPTKTDFKLYTLGRDGVDDGGDEELDAVFKRPAKDIYDLLTRGK